MEVELTVRLLLSQQGVLVAWTTLSLFASSFMFFVLSVFSVLPFFIFAIKFF